MKNTKLTQITIITVLTLISAAIIAQQGGANTPDSAPQAQTLDQQIQDDVLGSVRKNALASSAEEWNESGFRPFEVFKNIHALRTPEAWASLCRALQGLSDEDLALFEDEIQNPAHQGQLTCAQPLSLRISAYWRASETSLRYTMSHRLLQRGQSADLPLSPLPSEERHVDASRGETLSRGDLRDGEIAITLDDGPHPTRTPRILKILRDNGVRANFFSVGEMARRSPHILEAVVADTQDALGNPLKGHIVGSHSWSHKNLRNLDISSARREIESGRDAVYAATGMRVPFFRFPYGARNETIANWVATEGSGEQPASGMTSFLWNMDSLDWKIRNPQALLRNAIRQLDQERGGIILFHDIHEQTAIVLPLFIDELRTRGFKTVVFVPH